MTAAPSLRIDPELERIDGDLTRLGLAAVETLKRDLHRYGNRVSGKHAQALSLIIDRYGTLAARLETGRWAYGLDTGCGKTLSAVAWIAALLKLEMPFTVAVAASHVEALCDMKRALVERGADPEAIGLQHSKVFHEEKASLARRGGPSARRFASLPATADNHLRQVVLATHERLRSREKQELFNLHRGRDRDLIIWDESLLIAESRSFLLFQAERGLKWLEAGIFRKSNRHPERVRQEEAVEYLEECVGLLQGEREAQENQGAAPARIVLPRPARDVIGDYRRLVAEEFDSGSGSSHEARALGELLNMSANPLRLALVGDEGAVVQYDIAVPDELQRVVILDASYPIRALQHLDTKIQCDPGFDGRVKRYSRVTVHHWRRSSGRSPTQKEFSTKRGVERSFSREIVEVAKKVPMDEAVLVFTFKQREMNIVSALRSDLESAGVDPEATLPDGRSRFVFLTWGRETSLSEFSYCSNVIFAGVLHRAVHDLAAATVGQQRDLLVPITRGQIEQVRRSEVAHSIYQALSRGSCRIVEAGEARPMRVWLPHYDEGVIELIQQAMPGVRIQAWRPLPAPRTSLREAAEALAVYLVNLPSDEGRVSLRKLKKETGLSRCSPSTFQRAREKALMMLPGWRRVKGSLVRRESDF